MPIAPLAEDALVINHQFPELVAPEAQRTAGLLPAQLGRELPGLSIPEYEVLVHLSEAPGGRLRPFQLAEATHWEQSRLSHPLSRMTRRGFVARQDCPGDRRGAEVVLTRAGRAALESAAPGHVAAVRRLVFDQMDSAQVAAFGQAFEAILAGLENTRLLPFGAPSLGSDVFRVLGFG